MKCEYCVMAHTYEAKKDEFIQEEIKTAIMVAGVVSLSSTIIYSSQDNQKNGSKSLNN